MQWLKTILREVYGLFVDDAGFALAIVAWLGGWWLLWKYAHLSAWPATLLLFAGLAVILVESATRFARRHSR